MLKQRIGLSQQRIRAVIPILAFRQHRAALSLPAPRNQHVSGVHAT
jgi:hypothetical protein